MILVLIHIYNEAQQLFLSKKCWWKGRISTS